MDEAQRLADRVAVIAPGGIVAEGTPRHDRRPGHRGRPHPLHLPPGVTVGELPVAGRATVEGRVVDRHRRRRSRALHALTGWALERGVAARRA